MPINALLFKKSMSAYRIKRVLYLLVMAFIAGSINFCSKAPPAEEQIRTKMNSAKQAIENLNPDALEDILAPDFEIRTGNKNYDLPLIQKTMKLYALKKQKINVTLGVMQIEMDPYNTHLAVMSTSALITGGRGLLPEDGRIYTVKTKWRLYGDQWLITHISWE
jgi:hypothetical protein